MQMRAKVVSAAIDPAAPLHGTLTGTVPLNSSAPHLCELELQCLEMHLAFRHLGKPAPKHQPEVSLTSSNLISATSGRKQQCGFATRNFGEDSFLRAALVVSLGSYRGM
uniref:Uncharacterized protein n=1 Tax=Knipowitschia caucasica TaxID=637954 RepID=A0AAV2J1C5_KNICA